jgi:hypothetical protein
MLTSTLPDLEEAGQVGDRWEAGPRGGSVAVSRRDYAEPVHVQLRCAHDYHVFEVEETKSAPRPGRTHLSNR